MRRRYAATSANPWSHWPPQRKAQHLINELVRHPVWQSRMAGVRKLNHTLVSVLA
jgi:hypothetical protein